MANRALVYKLKIPPDYQDDTRHMRATLQERGYTVSEGDVYLAWQEYSNATNKGWWIPPPKDAEMFTSIIMDFFE